MTEKVTIDTNQVCQILRKTMMTIYRYRHREEDPIPFFYVENSLASRDNQKKPVRFHLEDVLDWARRNKIPSYSLPEKSV